MEARTGGGGRGTDIGKGEARGASIEKRRG